MSNKNVYIRNRFRYNEVVRFNELFQKILGERNMADSNSVSFKDKMAAKAGSLHHLVLLELLWTLVIALFRFQLSGHSS